MPGLARPVRHSAVIERVGCDGCQWRSSSGDREAVEQHGDAALASLEDRPGERDQFGASNLKVGLDRVRQTTDSRQRVVDHAGLSCKTGIVDAGASPDPLRSWTTAGGSAQRRRCGRVPDTHLAEDQQVGVECLDRSAAGVECCAEPIEVHRRAQREVVGRFPDTHVDDVDRRPGDAAECVDRRHPGTECADHRCGHLGRIRADARSCHAVIAGEDERRRPLDRRRGRALPSRHPHREIVEALQRPSRPEDVRRALHNSVCRAPVGARKRVQQLVDVGSGGHVRSSGRCSTSTCPATTSQLRSAR